MWHPVQRVAETHRFPVDAFNEFARGNSKKVGYTWGRGWSGCSCSVPVFFRPLHPPVKSVSAPEHVFSGHTALIRSPGAVAVRPGVVCPVENRRSVRDELAKHSFWLDADLDA